MDVAGHVVASADAKFREGDAVLVTGSGLSETRDGGYSEYARLESRWAVALPAGLDLRESMILGTAGFTAALALLRMEENRQSPQLGPLAVTGATGGVGSLAIDIFSSAGYAVRSEEHTSELPSLMRITYAVSCFKQKTNRIQNNTHQIATNRNIRHYKNN